MSACLSLTLEREKCLGRERIMTGTPAMKVCSRPVFSGLEFVQMCIVDRDGLHFGHGNKSCLFSQGLWDLCTQLASLNLWSCLCHRDSDTTLQGCWGMSLISMCLSFSIKKAVQLFGVKAITHALVHIPPKWWPVDQVLCTGLIPCRVKDRHCKCLLDHCRRVCLVLIYRSLGACPLHAWNPAPQSAGFADGLLF